MEPHLVPGNKLLITGSSVFNGPQLGAPSVIYGRSGCDEFAFTVGAEKVGRIRNADNPRLAFAPSQGTGSITRHTFDGRTVNAPMKDSFGWVKPSEFDPRTSSGQFIPRTGAS